MAYVITRLCIDCLDMGCVEVCPVECIYQPKNADADALPNMLFIHPAECISCGACEPECPWQAIFEDREIPPEFADDVGMNARVERSKPLFSVATMNLDAAGRIQRKPRPTTEQVGRNKARWQKS